MESVHCLFTIQCAWTGLDWTGHGQQLCVSADYLWLVRWIHYCTLLHCTQNHILNIIFCIVLHYTVLYLRNPNLSNNVNIVYSEIRPPTIPSYTSLKGFALSRTTTQHCKKSDPKTDNTDSLFLRSINNHFVCFLKCKW